MASTYLTRTPSSAGNRRTFTISVWVKFSGDGDNVAIFNAWSDDSNSGHFTFKRSSTNSSIGWSQWALDNYSNRSIRDVNAFYHLVLAVDTTQSTASDRQKFYINGEQITSWNSSYNMGLNEQLPVNNTNIHTIGINKYSSIGNYFNGSMSHFHFVDGLALAPTVFGSTDATTGEWKINTSPTISDYGTNGFFILKDGNSVTDQSGKGNNWTVGAGTLTKTEDCPSNVFATGNPLDPNSISYSVGNTKLNWSQSAGTHGITTGTLGMTTGKFYWEAKITSADNSTGIGLGVIQTEPYLSRTTSTGVNSSLFYGLGARFTTAKAINKTSNSVDSSISDTWSNDDIIRIAYDGDAGKIYMWKGTAELNGQTFSSNTSFNSATLTAGTMVLPYINFGDGGSGTKTAQVELNFGNGYFGTTAVSSAGTNASNIGIFEHDVPSGGYTALSTKGLNE